MPSPIRNLEKLMSLVRSGEGCYGVMCPECSSSAFQPCRDPQGNISRRHASRRSVSKLAAPTSSEPKRKARGIAVLSNGTTISYKKYIASPEWKLVRDEYARTHSLECSVCGGTSNIHLHHRTYERLGNENHEDLIPLCAEHHQMIHELAKELSGSDRIDRKEAKKKERDEFNARVWEKSCRACRAKPGEPCKSKNGGHHPIRVKEAKII